jgi:hypothetical protein
MRSEQNFGEAAMSWIPGWDSVAGAGWWSGFYFWVSIGCLIGLGVAEIASHRYGDRKDNLADAEQRETQRRHDEDMARVQHDTAQAIERAAQLEKEAAEARVGIARANADAARARAEQERLKQMVVWRSISDDMAKSLTARLSIRKEPIVLAVVANDPEAMFLATQLTKILTNASWTAFARSVSWGNWLPIGIHIYGPDNDTVRLLRESFTAVGVPFDSHPPPRQPDVSVVFPEDKETNATILIGSRIGPL